MRNSSRINDRGPWVRGRATRTASGKKPPFCGGRRIEFRIQPSTAALGAAFLATCRTYRRAAGRTTVVGASPWPDVRNKAYCCCASDRGRILQSYKPASSICKHTTRRPETKRILQTYVVLVGQNNERQGGSPIGKCRTHTRDSHVRSSANINHRTSSARARS